MFSISNGEEPLDEEELLELQHDLELRLTIVWDKEIQSLVEKLGWI